MVCMGFEPNATGDQRRKAHTNPFSWRDKFMKVKETMQRKQ